MHRGDKRKLPKSGAKRYGHLSSVRPGQVTKRLAKSGYFEWWLQKAKKILKVEE